MAFGGATSLGATGSTSNNQSALVLTLGATGVSVGELVVICIADDNRLSGADADAGEVSSVDDNAVGVNVWHNDPGTGWSYSSVGTQAGAHVSIWWTIAASAISATTGTITATFTNNTLSDATAITAYKFTIGAGQTVAVEATNQASGAATSTPGSLDATTANIACLRVRAFAAEVGNNTSLTPTSGWTAWANGNSATTGTTAEMVVRAEHHISTGTSDPSNPTWAVTCDKANVYVAFKEIGTTQALTPAKFTSAAVSFKVPVVAPGVRTLTPARFISATNAFGTPVVAPGTRTVTATKFVHGDTFGTPTVGTGSPLLPTNFTESDTFGVPSMAQFTAPEPLPTYFQAVPYGRYYSPLLFGWTTRGYSDNPLGPGETRPDIFVEVNTFGNNFITPEFFASGRHQLWEIPKRRPWPIDWLTHLVGSFERESGDLSAVKLTSTNTFGTPSIGKGPVTALPTRRVDPDTFGTPVVGAGAVTTVPTKYVDPDTFYVPFVGGGTITALPTKLTDADTFHAQIIENVVDGQVSPHPRFDEADVFYQPSIATSAGALIALRFVQPNTFGTAVVGRGPVGLQATKFTDADIFRTEVVGVGTTTVLPARFVRTNIFGSPVVGGFSQQTQPARFMETNLFYSVLAALAQQPQDQAYLTTGDYTVGGGGGGGGYFAKYYGSRRRRGRR